ncbi:unnamed protein product, partial [Didymodactylos carnosus]
PITKLMQYDHLSYFTLMETIKEKRNVLKCWASQSTLTMGPALSDYVQLTDKGSLGSFKINMNNRQKLFNDCYAHIERIFRELDRRFSPSKVQENLSVLFDPQYLIKNKKKSSFTNSAECERGFSAANRIQTSGRSHLMISTLEVLMNVRLLLTDDLRSVR